jgi:hypothetical protein
MITGSGRPRRLAPWLTLEPIMGGDRRDRGAARAALQAVNFCMADMQAGIGPFLGVFLLARGWETGAIGVVSTLGGLAGMLAIAPAGALVDATTRKRSVVVVGAGSSPWPRRG